MLFGEMNLKVSGKCIRINRSGLVKKLGFVFGSSEDKAGKEAKCRPTGW